MHSRIRWQEQPTSYFPNVLCWDARVSLYEASNVTGSSPANRCLLWVDAVGGYLVCLSDQVILGQAVPGTTIDVPVLADLSRRHAMIERRGEQYLIHPIGLVTLRGQKLTDVGWLRDVDFFAIAALSDFGSHVMESTNTLRLTASSATRNKFGQSIVTDFDGSII